MERGAGISCDQRRRLRQYDGQRDIDRKRLEQQGIRSDRRDERSRRLPEIPGRPRIRTDDFGQRCEVAVQQWQRHHDQGAEFQRQSGRQLLGGQRFQELHDEPAGGNGADLLYRSDLQEIQCDHELRAGGRLQGAECEQRGRHLDAGAEQCGLPLPGRCGFQRAGKQGQRNAGRNRLGRLRRHRRLPQTGAFAGRQLQLHDLQSGRRERRTGEQRDADHLQG